MIQIKNNSSKRITFPDISFSIGPYEKKEITDDMSTRVLTYPDVIKVEKKEEKKENFKSRRHYKK